MPITKDIMKLEDDKRKICDRTRLAGLQKKARYAKSVFEKEIWSQEMAK